MNPLFSTSPVENCLADWFRLYHFCHDNRNADAQALL